MLPKTHWECYIRAYLYHWKHSILNTRTIGRVRVGRWLGKSLQGLWVVHFPLWYVAITNSPWPWPWPWPSHFSFWQKSRFSVAVCAAWQRPLSRSRIRSRTRSRTCRTRSRSRDVYFGNTSCKKMNNLVMVTGSKFWRRILEEDQQLWQISTHLYSLSVPARRAAATQAAGPTGGSGHGHAVFILATCPHIFCSCIHAYIIAYTILFLSLNFS